MLKPIVFPSEEKELTLEVEIMQEEDLFKKDEEIKTGRGKYNSKVELTNKTKLQSTFY